MQVLNRQSLWTLSAVVFFCLIFVAQLLLSVRRQSETFDEPCHMYAGYRSLKYGDFGINPEHPPLVKMVAALPLVHLANVPEDPKRYFRLDCATGGRALLSGNDTDKQLFRARSAAAIFGLALMIMLFLGVREMFGKGPAFLALVIAAFDPNLLANGALVTTDMAVTCLLFASVYAFWRYTERPSIARLLICGLAAGLTLASKHSGLFVLPLLGVLALVDWIIRERKDDSAASESRGRKALRLAGALAAIVVIAFAILWSFYGFRYRARPAALDIAPPLAEYSAPLAKTPLNRPLAFLERRHILPESYLYGLIDVLYVSHGRPTFLLGTWYLTGRWYYFPAALLIKSTLAFMGLLVLAIVAFLVRKRSPEAMEFGPATRRLLFLILPPILYLLMSMTSKLNIGIRHVLPIIPFLIALTAAGVWLLWRRGRVWTVVVIVLVGFHVISSLRSFPDYLPYSNELFGGTAKTYEVLNSSNVDWGQGLKETGRYLEARQDIGGDCWIAYFGTGVPVSYGVHCKPLPGFYNLLVAQYIPTGGCAAKDPEIGGTLIIGANTMTGTFNGPLDLNPYARFLHETPAANIGGSMLVFRGRYQLPAIAAFCHELDASRLLQANEADKAGDEARAAVAMAPQDVGGHILLGDVLLKLKQNDAAKAEFETALYLAESLDADYQAPVISGIKRRLNRLAENR